MALQFIQCHWHVFRGQAARAVVVVSARRDHLANGLREHPGN